MISKRRSERKLKLNLLLMISMIFSVAFSAVCQGILFPSSMSIKFSVGYLVGINTSECGYCHTTETGSSKSFGIWIYSMSVEQYQLMIDRGWRRSGKYLYKPDILSTCCPPYTIRLDSHAFKPTKGQKKVLKKMQKYLLNGKLATPENMEIDKDPIAPAPSKQNTDIPVPDASMIPELSGNIATDHVAGEMEVEGDDSMKVDQPIISKPKVKKPILNVSDGIDKLFKTIESPDIEMLHKIRVELIPSAFSKDVYDLYVKYQIAIHGDKEEELSERRFKEFLVDTPFDPSGDSSQYGSFHQKYFIDNKLIAVAVIDVLPTCVSSVYFLYDPSYGSLSLGTYSAIREIATTYDLSLKYPSLRYYYLGYYIHSCPKMAYKARYAPSELLCPYTFKWFPASEAIPLLGECKTSILDTLTNSDMTRKDPLPFKDAPKRPASRADIGNVKLVENNRLVFASTKLNSNQDLLGKLKQLIEISGAVVLDKLALVF